METTNYNKAHILQQELKEIETLTERVKSASSILSGEIEFFKLVSNELDTAAKVIIPSLKSYLETVRDVRMAFGREVQEVLRSSRELTTIVKSRPELEQICETIIKIDKSLSDDLISKIKKTFNVSENE